MIWPSFWRPITRSWAIPEHSSDCPIHWSFRILSRGNSNTYCANFRLRKEQRMREMDRRHCRRLSWRTSFRCDTICVFPYTAGNPRHHQRIQSRVWHTSVLHCRSGTCHIQPSTTICWKWIGLRSSVCMVWWMSSGAFVPGRSRSFHLECRTQLCSRPSWDWSLWYRPTSDARWSNRKWNSQEPEVGMLEWWRSPGCTGRHSLKS